MRKILTFFVLLLCYANCISAETNPNIITVANEDGKMLNYYLLGNEKKYASLAAPYAETDYAGEIKIPNFIMYNNLKYIVYSVESNVFDSNEYITSIEIGDSIVFFNDNYFRCINLKKLVTGNRFYYLPNYNIYDEDMCDLTHLTIGDSLNYIGDCIFTDSIVEIIVSENNRHYSSQNNVLYNNDKTELIRCGTDVTHLEFPNSVKTINENAFRGCFNLKSIALSDSIKEFENYIFESCKKLEYIKLGSSIENVDFIRTDYGYADSLKQIEVSADNQYFSSVDGILYNKEQTLLILCPAKTEVIDLVLPNNLDSIRYIYKTSDRSKEAFYAINYNFKSISIGSELKSLGGLFNYSGSTEGKLPKLESIYVNGNNIQFSSQDGVLYNKDKTKIIVCPAMIRGELVLPNTLASIGDDNEWQNYFTSPHLMSIKIPNSVRNICAGAFIRSTSLASIKLPNKLEIIHESLLQECSNLERLELPSSLKEINGLDYYNPFMGCDKLTTVICYAIEPPIVEDAFPTRMLRGTLYVPEESINAYKNDVYWEDFRNIKPLSEAPTSVNEIGDSTNISIYPNPAKDYIYINGIEIKSASAFNMSGAEYGLNTEAGKINVSNLSSGSYILKVIDENNKTYSSKFIKQ